VTLKKS